MITATIHEAKAKLSHLVERACAGEEVVLFKGSKVVARIQPLTEVDLQLAEHLTDKQAKTFWDEINTQNKKSFSTMKSAVEFLKKN